MEKQIISFSEACERFKGQPEGFVHVFVNGTDVTDLVSQAVTGVCEIAYGYVADQPVADQPVADQPVADQPVADQPVADQPVADHE